MPIKEVVIGLGRSIKYWHRGGIRWSLRIIPFGAHVHLKGTPTTLSDESAPKTGFAEKPYWQRAITTLAGPAINLAVIPVLFFGFYATIGLPSTPAVLVGIDIGHAADKAGFKLGDEFLAVDGIPITNEQDMWRYAYPKGAKKSTYTIKRGDKIFEKAFTPDWTEYIDREGVERKNARFGVMWQHAPFKLEAIENINGVDVKGDEDRAREILIKNFGKTATLILKGPTDEKDKTRIFIHETPNKGLLDKDDKFYDKFFPGPIMGNIYLKKPLSTQFENALRYSGHLIKSVAGIPFHIFPVDKTLIRDQHAVSHPDTKIINKIYALIHSFAVASIVIGLINLLPLPNLDGGQFMIQTIERFKKHPLTRKSKAKIYALAFLLFYFSALTANLDNIPRYIDSRAKKVQEFMIEKKRDKDESQTTIKDEIKNG